VLKTDALGIVIYLIHQIYNISTDYYNNIYLVFYVFGGQIEIVQIWDAFAIGIRILARREIGAANRHSPNIVLDTVISKIRPVARQNGLQTIKFKNCI
jgi:hypothetical protein